MATQVLFVCLGNICRSPTAHGLFQHKVERAGLTQEIHIESAGTGAWHVGKSPDARAQAKAAERGYDLSAIRARQVEPADFERFDYILAMDESNLDDLQSMAPENFSGQLSLFLDFAGNAEHREVPDPYYGGDRGFELVLDLVEQACDGLLQEIRQAGNQLRRDV